MTIRTEREFVSLADALKKIIPASASHTDVLAVIGYLAAETFEKMPMEERREELAAFVLILSGVVERPVRH